MVKRVVLKPRKAGPFYARHPWVLDSAIDRLEGGPGDGDVVDLISDKGKFIARGIHNGRSRIRCRLYTWNAEEAIDDAFWRRRLAAAVELRNQLGYGDRAAAARLVFSEGDRLSGLIVDRYGEHLVVQPTALAMAGRLEGIIAALVDIVRPLSIMVRFELGMSRAEGIETANGPRWGEPPAGPVCIDDGSIRFGVDLAGGQKTGFYLDQRENRRAAARYCHGRRVLDMFCYSGGFAIAAAGLGKAREVLAFDSSSKAVALARANAELNELNNVRVEAGDGFAVLESLLAQGERFGTVILDPPRFARSRRNLPEALRAYHWLNRLAVSLVEPGGFLVTCSCSGHVGRQDFHDVLVGVGQQTGRELQILERRGAAPDHPVLASCPEGDYLKCLIVRAL